MIKCRFHAEEQFDSHHHPGGTADSLGVRSLPIHFGRRVGNSRRAGRPFGRPIKHANDEIQTDLGMIGVLNDFQEQMRNQPNQERMRSLMTAFMKLRTQMRLAAK